MVRNGILLYEKSCVHLVLPLSSLYILNCGAHLVVMAFCYHHKSLKMCDITILDLEFRSLIYDNASVMFRFATHD